MMNLPSSLLQLVILLSIAAGGCSSFDDDVFPHVVTASLRVDRMKPDELATLDVSVRIEAGRTAHRGVALRSVELHPTDGAGSFALDMAFPVGDTITLNPGEATTVSLANSGTTNAALTPLCGRPGYLFVSLAYPDEPSSWTGSGADTPLITVTCH
jgi:hypothetical protein